MNYSYRGIGEVTASFGVKDGAQLAAGTPVKLSASGEVTACAAGDAPMGVVCVCRNGCAAVQLRGTAAVACSGAAISPGYVKLAADGNGGVCAGTAREFLVLAVEDGTAVIML